MKTLTRFFLIILCLWGTGVDAADPAPVRLEVQPLKNIYTPREGLGMQFVLTARERAKVCLEKDVLSQMQFTIHRAGAGELALEPLVTRNNRALFDEPMIIHWLEPGESVTVRANLKRFGFRKGQAWQPGEYAVRATFMLCEQTNSPVVTDLGREIPIRSEKNTWFMIMH